MPKDLYFTGATMTFDVTVRKIGLRSVRMLSQDLGSRRFRPGVSLPYAFGVRTTLFEFALMYILRSNKREATIKQDKQQDVSPKICTLLLLIFA